MRLFRAMLLTTLLMPAAALAAPLKGTHITRQTLANPYGHIPAQCYIETAGGTQNPCQYCHTDALAARGFGNNVPQGGLSSYIGDLTADYAFAALNWPINRQNGSINPWDNTLHPDRLAQAVAEQGENPEDWDMTAWIAQDNWTPAFAQRPGNTSGDWDTGAEGNGFRLFPALNPADLPADPDGFVRDAAGKMTGWRAVNFVPHGIFTPLTGSVSGIYIRLPERFRVNAAGVEDAGVYAANLDLLSDAIQDRLTEASPRHYVGGAATDAVEPGLYPQGTEFAHPLHYVDTDADGRDGRLPGTRAARVKEIRYMYKLRRFDPGYGNPALKEESAPLYANRAEAWVDNGAGWLLAGWIEDAQGALRPQTPDEMVQCVGCHSGHMPQPETGGYPDFQSGVGTTIDSTWALPRRLPGADGWREMDMMGYRADPAGGIGAANRPDPVNRALQAGEFAHFLRAVVGVSLYGDMPASVEDYLRKHITADQGYTADWPEIATGSVDAWLKTHRLRAQLLAELTDKGGHLAADGNLAGVFLYPPRAAALEAARRYRQVVATQRFALGKDVFAQTPMSFRYFRDGENGFAHQDGRPYDMGEVITDRPIDTEPTSLTYGIDIAPTEVIYSPDYAPLLD